jgi:hypothetical protein
MSVKMGIRATSVFKTLWRANELQHVKWLSGCPVQNSGLNIVQYEFCYEQLSQIKRVKKEKGIEEKEHLNPRKKNEEHDTEMSTL